MTPPDFHSWTRENLNNYARDAWQQHQDAQEMPTLRDMFAMFATVGIIASQHEAIRRSITVEDVAELAYAQADALKEDRKKK